MYAPSGESDWVKVLRDRTHKLTSTCTALELQTTLLQKQVSELSEKVTRMATADEIAKGVADELRLRDVGHRAKVDSSMKRSVWIIGTVLAAMQIVEVSFAIVHH